MSSRPALALIGAAVLLMPAAALACDEKPLPACEGSGCSARQLLKDVDGALRRTGGGCKVEPAPSRKAGKPSLLEMLKGKRESTVLPASRKDEAQGGQVI